MKYVKITTIRVFKLGIDFLNKTLSSSDEHIENVIAIFVIIRANMLSIFAMTIPAGPILTNINMASMNTIELPVIYFCILCSWVFELRAMTKASVTPLIPIVNVYIP